MAKLLGISEGASLALHTMVLLSRRDPLRMSSGEIAEAFGASGNTLAKVLARLVKAGLLEGVTGPGGGYRLARGAEETALLEVFEAVEGPLGEVRCLLGEPICGGEECILGGLVESIQERVREYLGSTTLSELAGRVALGAV